MEVILDKSRSCCGYDHLKIVLLFRVDLSKPRLTAPCLLSQIHDFKLRNYGLNDILRSLSRIRECQHRSHHHPYLGCYQTQTKGKGITVFFHPHNNIGVHTI